MKSGMALLPTENSECLRTQLGSRIRSRTGYIICGIGIVLTGTRTKSPTSNSPKRKGAQRRLASRGRGQLKSHCLTDASLCAQRRLASRGRGLAKRLKLEVWAFRAQRRLASRGRGRPCWRPRRRRRSVLNAARAQPFQGDRANPCRVKWTRSREARGDFDHGSPWPPVPTTDDASENAECGCVAVTISRLEQWRALRDSVASPKGASAVRRTASCRAQAGAQAVDTRQVGEPAHENPRVQRGNSRLAVESVTESGTVCHFSFGIRG